VRVFLGAHRARLAALRIEEARLLDDLAAILDELDLPAHLELDRLLEEAERVEVLDLAARSERRAGLAHGDVRVATERPLLHVAVADADPAHQRMQRLRVRHRSAAERMSGSETISRSGVPARFRSTPLMPWNWSWRSLPASSSRCARVSRTVFSTPPTTIGTVPPETTGIAYWLIWYPFGRSG
jgi:hypothetical protein